MVEGREGPYPTAQAQLLVYGTDGHLEVVADGHRAAALDWKSESDGPKLARAVVAGHSLAGDLTITAAVAVAKQ